jgi:adenylate kinase family enzyme
MKPLYVMLIGLPGSGKSTLAKVIQAAHPGANWHVVSTDDYIEAEAAKRGTTYDAVFKETIDEATTRMNVLRGEAMAARRNIIHDQTNLTIKSRARKLAGIPAY